MRQLTAIQSEVLDFIKKCQSSGYTPSKREISDNFGWSSANAAQEHLVAIEKKGYVTLVKGKNRRIIVNESSKDK